MFRGITWAALLYCCFYQVHIMIQVLHIPLFCLHLVIKSLIGQERSVYVTVPLKHNFVLIHFIIHFSFVTFFYLMSFMHFNIIVKNNFQLTYSYRPDFSIYLRHIQIFLFFSFVHLLLMFCIARYTQYLSVSDNHICSIQTAKCLLSLYMLCF